MEKRVGSSVGIAAFLVVILHLFTGSSADHPANPSPLKKEAAASEHPSADTEHPEHAEGKGPWLATRQLFHRNGLPADAAQCESYLLPSEPPRPARCERSSMLSMYGIDSNFDVKNLTTLIATIPDPLHTRMSVETDRELDAIQQAAYHSGWELATQWLPWTFKANPAATSMSLDSEHLDIEKYPGLLVFRRHFTSTDVMSQLLLIFVVGETPTAGINGYQFEFARRSICKMWPAHPHRIAIMGPKFSGSFMSLTKFIGDDTEAHHYDVRAGSVSNMNYAATMLEALKVNQGYSIDDTAQCKRSITFHASTLPSSAFTKQFWQLAHDSWGYGHEQLAELIEDQSGFSFQPPHPGKHQPEEESPDNIIRYRYPRNIAQLRNSYSDVAFSNGQKQDESTAPAVEFSLKDTQSGEDTFPIFSTNHTPVSQNAILEQIVTNLNHRHVRVVSLTSTNVFDTIFLAKVIARYCPDTRIVLSGADLLFVEEANTGSLTGVMAISPFPNFPEGSLWADPEKKDITTFAESDSIGDFNATLSLLKGPLSETQPFEGSIASKPNDFLAPWVLVLSRSGWLPVDLLEQANPLLDEGRPAKQSALNAAPTRNRSVNGPRWFDDSQRPPAHDLIHEQKSLPKVSRAWTTLCILIASVAIGFCVRLYYLKTHCCLLVWSTLCLADLVDRSRPVNWLVHFRYLSLVFCLATLAFIVNIFLSPLFAARFVYHSPVAEMPLELLVLAGFLAPLVTAIHISTLVPFRAFDEHPGSCTVSQRLSLAAVSIRAAVLLVPLAGAVCWWTCCATGVKGWFVCFRSFTLSIPVSPIWPLLLSALALFVIGFSHLCRFTWVERQQPSLNTATFDEFLWGQFGILKSRLNRVLQSPAQISRVRKPPIVLLATLASIFLLVLLFPAESLRSFESRSFEDLLICMLLPIGMLLALTFLQFAYCWSTFHEFLTTLQTLDLGRFFAQLPDFRGSAPIWVREVKVLSLMTATNSSIALHNLQSSGALRKTWNDRYRLHLGHLFSRRDQNRSRAQFIKAYRVFGHVSARITQLLGNDILKPYWKRNAIHFIDEEAEAPVKASAVAVGATLILTTGRGGASASNPTTESVTEESYAFASKYVALQFAAYISYILRHLQNLLLCCTLSYALLVLALNSFSFQAPRAISEFLILSLIVGAAIVVRFLIQSEHDVILNRLSGTSEHEIGTAFYIKLLAYGALPVLTVLGTQFPAISRFVSEWAEPTLAAVR